MLDAALSRMKFSLKLLLFLAAATAVFLVQPVKADRIVEAGPTVVSVPDAGSTLPVLGCALLGLAAFRRKLGC